MARRYWLMKTEPDVFSITDLRRRPGATECWDGVRNYQARNLLRDEIRIGDGVLFYHSSCKVPGVAGLAQVVRAGYPDPTQFDRRAKYHDPKSSRDQPRWYAVDVRFEKEFERLVTLAEMREIDTLAGMKLLQTGMRLSVQPVTPAEWKTITALGRRRAGI